MISWLRNLSKTVSGTKVSIAERGLKVRQALKLMKEGNLHPSELFPRLAAEKPTWFMPGGDGDGHPRMFGTIQGHPVGVIFSEYEVAATFMGQAPFQPEELGSYSLLQTLLRGGVKGLIINPGSEQVVLDYNHLRLLFREYALVEGAKLAGAWVPVRDDSLLVVELRDEVYTVPVFLSGAEAEAVCRQHGGVPTLVTWHRVRERCREVGADAAFLGYSFPEEVGVTRRQLTQLCADGQLDPLDRLEDEVKVSLGIANAAAIMRAMSQLEHVWTLVDGDGDFVQAGETFDIFTTCGQAEDFIKRVGAEGQAFPRYCPARPLFEAVAPKSPTVGINRAGSDSWLGFGDTLPFVVSLFHVQ